VLALRIGASPIACESCGGAKLLLLVLTVCANYTDRRTAQAELQQLEGGGTRAMGIVLNRWDPVRSDMCAYSTFGGLPGGLRPECKPGL
jgi:hypothetical protein